MRPSPAPSSAVSASVIAVDPPPHPLFLPASVVCGGGPTGVEFAAELVDLFNEDAFAYFPKLLRSNLSVSIVQSRDHILNTYSEKISQYAEKRFAREDMRVVTSAFGALHPLAPLEPVSKADPPPFLPLPLPCRQTPACRR